MKLQFNGKAYGMDGVYWCMQFVWWCFQQADKTLFMDGGKTASCGELMRWAQAHGQWVTTGYRPGDVLIYDFPGTVYKKDRPRRNLRERQRAVCHRHRGQYLQRQHRQPVKRRRRVPPQAQALAGARRVPPEVHGLPRGAPEARGAGGQDDGLPRGVQVRQRPHPQAGNDEIICPIRAEFKRLCPAWAQPYP